MLGESLFESPLASRYCRRGPLVKLFSEENKTKTWRQLWVWLAEAEMDLGIDMVTKEKVDEMRSNIGNIDWEFVRAEEGRVRHDVMAHIHAFERVAPLAAGIIHLGATSAFVQDNTDILLMRDAMDHCLTKIAVCLHRFDIFASHYKSEPTVGLTHYQAATLTTIGKRAAMWAQDLLIGFNGLKTTRTNLRFRGIKGATGSLASFLTLFSGDGPKVHQLNEKVTQLAGFKSETDRGSFTITGQTYTRLQDAEVLNAMAVIGAAIHKICMDIRILQSRNELMEPFEESQVGSSAMPYKRNPMRSERCCGFARFLINLPANSLNTAALAGFERTLDDSSNRRLVLPEAFLTLEAALTTLQNILEGLRVMNAKVRENVMEELPFLALEPILMELTLGGVSRQEGHDHIRTVAMKAHELRAKNEKVDMAKILSQDHFFDPVKEKIKEILLDPGLLIGLCPEQVEKFLTTELRPAIEPYQSSFGTQAKLTV